MGRRSSVLASVVVVLGLVACGDNKRPPDVVPPDEVCEELPPTSSGATCEVTAGGAARLIKGVVLTPDKALRGGQVAIDAAGKITCVGCDCAAGGETVITCPDGAISPGLVNPHEHLTFSQNPPYNDTGARYEHRHQWRLGQDGLPEIPAPGNASTAQIQWAELRFLMGGATSIAGAGGRRGLLRNLDTNMDEQEGLGQGVVNSDTFPLADNTDGLRRVGECGYGANARTAANIAALDAYEPHTSEGIDATARNEFLCESLEQFDPFLPGKANNLLLSKTAMIHAIALLPVDLGAMAVAGTALVWSPRSNVTLYGDTARVTIAKRLGVDIALGTDWLPTGSMNVLRELRCADSLNTTYFDGAFDDRDLWRMVTQTAAAVTATDDVIGVLAPGKVADIAVFAAHGKTYRSVIDAEPQDVALVMRGGKVLYGDDGAVTALATSCDAVDVCGTGKRVCLMDDIATTYSQLQAAAGANIYPAFQCGAPPDEPTCVPSRPTSVQGSTVYTGIPSSGDSDGDGLPNAADKCPSVFDPIRPVDGGAQGDSDGDGLGDACDPCPLDANSTACTAVSLDDRDQDGRPNAADNCAGKANADQADGDGDNKGDVCDVCPADRNQDGAGCPVTIYSIKEETTPLGFVARLTNALVTGKGSNGFFVQVKKDDLGEKGPDNSGLFVFAGAAPDELAKVKVGARVDVDGRVSLFQNQLQLLMALGDKVTEKAPGPEAPPDPVQVSYADIVTGGPRARTLESVLVELPASSVTAINAPAGEFTLTTATTENLIVDDFLFTAPVPAAPPVGTRFTGARGILTLRQNASKLELRATSDLLGAAPGIATFTPGTAFARVGETIAAATFPQALTITLTAPSVGDTTIVVMSADPAALTVSNLIIPDGERTGTIPVTVGTTAGTVAVTAFLGLQALTVNVRVLDVAEVPTTVTLSPALTTIGIGATLAMTVTLDIPTQSATSVDIGLAVDPVGAGTVLPAVTIAGNQISTTFTFTNLATEGIATVTATFGDSTSNSTIATSSGVNHLIINEVDYDQPGSDTLEFIEIFNPTPIAIDLTGKQIILFNGTGGASYRTIDLTGTLAGGGYAVVAAMNVTVPATAIRIMAPVNTDLIQNGAPDGIALVDNVAHTVIDVLSYEGSMTSVTLPGFPAAFSLVEGNPTAVVDAGAGSVCRAPNASDTDDSDTDWSLCTTVTAGLPNP